MEQFAYLDKDIYQTGQRTRYEAKKYTIENNADQNYREIKEINERYHKTTNSSVR